MFIFAAQLLFLTLFVPFSHGERAKENSDRIRGLFKHDVGLLKKRFIIKLREKRAVCEDTSQYCSSYKPYCNAADYKDYLKKNCRKTCEFCGCSDKITYCYYYKSDCGKTTLAATLRHHCPETCGFCQVTKTTATTTTPTTSPSTERAIDQGSVECGTKVLSTRIVGGTNSQSGAWPWQVTMDYKGRNTASHWCGGSIVSPQWIVSAAHCFPFGENPQKYSIVAGEHDLNETEGHEQHIKIDKIITHPKFVQETHDYDMALIKLQSPLTYNNRVGPVCLPKFDFAEGTMCFVKGWGHTMEGGNISQTLKQAQVPLISRDTCQKAYREKGYTITARMRCAGYAHGEIDACQGDSGGPLVCSKNDKWYLMGAVSWGIGCARKANYGVYADLMVLKYWVQETINKN